MAEMGEAPERKIVRLETELARAKRMEEAAKLPLMFVHEGRGKISMASNLVWLSKTETENMPSVTFQLTEVQMLDPMDIVSIMDTYPGISEQWIRILSIDESEWSGQYGGALTIDAEEYRLGTGQAALYNFQRGSLTRCYRHPLSSQRERSSRRSTRATACR